MTTDWDSLEGDVLKRIVDRSVSILTLDIETSPHKAWTFDVWDANISPEKIIEPSRLLMIGMKWYGRAKIDILSEHDVGHEEMVRRSWQAVDQAQILVHYNGIRFDLKHLKREWLLAGLPPPSPYKQVDLLRVMRREFAFPSNKLGAIGPALGIGAKIEHEGFALWRGCLDGDPKAWARMARYCRGDVRLTEQLYDRVRGWIVNHPHVTTSSQPRCNRCGSSDLTRLPVDYRAVVLDYAVYRCDNCGGPVKWSSSKRIASTRGVQ